MEVLCVKKWEYPNTFALFLLLGVVILALRETTVYEKNAQELDTSRHFARHRDRQRRVHQEKQIDLGDWLFAIFANDF